jgi:hypothetical protein
METRFKVGDRVRHDKYGDGTVKFFEHGDNHYAVEFDKETGWSHDGGGHCKLNHASWQMAINLALIESESEKNDPEPDRAMIAAMCLQGLLAAETFAGLGYEDPAVISVRYADALIAELAKPKQ